MSASALLHPAGSARLSTGQRRFALAGAVLAAEVALAAGMFEPHLALLLGAFMGVCAAALVFSYPLTSACLGLATVATFFYEGRFRWAVSAGSSQLPAVHLSEVILALLLVVAVLRPARHWWGGVPGAALAGFFLSVAVAIAVAVGAGRTDLRSATDLARPFFLLAYFYVAVRLVPGRARARRLLDTAAAVGGVVGATGVVVAFTPGLNHLVQDPTGAYVQSEGLGSLQRVRLPGLAFAYLLFWYAVYRVGIAQGGRRAAWLLITAGMAGGLVVSLNRNMWVGLAAGLVLALVAGSARMRRTIAVTVVAGAAAIATLVLVSPGAGSRAVMDPLGERASTLLRPAETLRERSLEDRADENRRAWRAVRPHLATGLGPAVPWGTSFRELTPTGNQIRVPQLFLHNQYLYLLVVGGLPALACFLALLLGGVLAAWRPRSRDPSLRPCAIGILMLMISATVWISLSIASWTAPIGLVLGLTALLGRLPADPASDPCSDPAGA